MEFEVQHLPPTEWVDLETVMKHLSVRSKVTMTRYIRSEGLPARKVGKRYLFDLTEVDAWVRARSRWSRRGAGGASA